MDSLIVAHEWHAASAYTANYPCQSCRWSAVCSLTVTTSECKVRSDGEKLECVTSRNLQIWFNCCSLSDGTLCDLHQETEQKAANVIISQSDVVLMDLTWCMMALILSVQHCNAIFITVPLQSFLQRYCPQFQLLLLLCFLQSVLSCCDWNCMSYRSLTFKAYKPQRVGYLRPRPDFILKSA